MKVGMHGCGSILQAGSTIARLERQFLPAQSYDYYEALERRGSQNPRAVRRSAFFCRADSPAGHTDKKNIADKKKVQVECLVLFQHVHHVFYDYDYVVG
jgi:hypothetical protein